MKYEHSCQLGSRRNWAGPGSMLNFWIFELKLQNFVHPSIQERDWFECGLWNLRLLYTSENYGNLVSESASCEKNTILKQVHILICFLKVQTLKAPPLPFSSFEIVTRFKIEQTLQVLGACCITKLNRNIPRPSFVLVT
jgi:hypothetical protein